MYAYPSFNEVLRPYIDYSTSNCLSRIEAESMVFISLPRIENSLSIDSSFIDCSGHCHIDQLTASKKHIYPLKPDQHAEKQVIEQQGMKSSTNG